MPDPDVQKTHHAECWQYHVDCAVREYARVTCMVLALMPDGERPRYALDAVKVICQAYRDGRVQESAALDAVCEILNRA